MRPGIKSINPSSQLDGPRYADFSGSGILGVIHPHLRNLIVLGGGAVA